MERNFVRKDEQIKLIMECRQSGLSDYQWCRQRDINPGTFYNWVSKLRKRGYTFPDSQSKSVGTAVVQEVVKLDVVEQEVSSPVIEQNACPLPLSKNADVAAGYSDPKVHPFRFIRAPFSGNIEQCIPVQRAPLIWLNDP